MVEQERTFGNASLFPLQERKTPLGFVQARRTDSGFVACGMPLREGPDQWSVSKTAAVRLWNRYMTNMKE